MRIVILIIGGALYVGLMLLELLKGWNPAVAFIGLMFIPSLLYWIMYAPEFWRQSLKDAWKIYKHSKPPEPEEAPAPKTERVVPLRPPSMSVAEACEILCISQDATRQEISEAHRRLMQKNHPDKGGSTHLAKLINEAKTILMKQTSMQG